jgi:hypothetical protein
MGVLGGWVRAGEALLLASSSLGSEYEEDTAGDS